MNLAAPDPPPLRSDWLAAFACFARHRNFTHAARELHLSQPALHVQIARLSAELGVTLYTRRGRALELTREGTTLLAFARDAEARSREIVAELRGEATAAPVALAAGEGAYLYLLGDALRAFARRSPVRIQVLTRDREGTIEAVRSGDAHLGVASVDVVPDDVVVTLLGQVGQVVILPAGHRLGRRRSLALADLEGSALVVPPAGRPHREALSGALAAAGVSWRVAAEANGWALIVHFVALGLGVAVVNDFCRLPRGLVARPLRGLPPVRYSLLTRRGARSGANVEALRLAIVDTVARRSAG